LFRKLIMKSPHLSKLNTESRQEYGALLLLDQLMRYELPRQERDKLRVTVAQLEEKVAELKKGFFHSVHLFHNSVPDLVHLSEKILF
jgi:hypothetical protein